MFSAWKLKKRLDSLEEAFKKLQGDCQSLELEWINTYSKLKKIMGRIAKDQSVINSREEGNLEALGADAGANGTQTPGLLTPRQREIQQQVLKRRGGVQ
jgi:hypothetical protein